MTHVALVIGNGFDLDLGLKTRYIDFANSPEWKEFIEMSGTIVASGFPVALINHLRGARTGHCWFDIEEEIYKFVTTHNGISDNQIGLIRMEYEKLKFHLRKYLCRVATIDNTASISLAKNLMMRVLGLNPCLYILSFNYTNCFHLCQCTKPVNCKFIPVHGTLSTADFILGCRNYDSLKGNTGLDFMYKPENNLMEELFLQNIEKASEVIIYGHSLNKMDFCYFEKYFDTMSSSLHSSDKHLTIFCKDDLSEMCIKDNLERYINLSNLYLNLDVKFIHTDYFYQKRKQELEAYESLCRRLCADEMH